MKVVIDNNTFVSSMFGGKPEAVVNRVLDGFDKLFISYDIINEIKKTFNKSEFKKPKYNITQDRIDNLINDIKEISKIVTILPQHKVIFEVTSCDFKKPHKHRIGRYAWIKAKLYCTSLTTRYWSKSGWKKRPSGSRRRK